MPRPMPAGLVAQPKVLPVELPSDLARALAAFVPEAALNADFIDLIRHFLGAYKGQTDAPGASVAETIELLRRVVQGGRKRPRALRALAHERAAVDDETHDRLRPLAVAVLRGEIDAIPQLEQLAHERIQQLTGVRRKANVEAFRLLCAHINLLFQAAHGRTRDVALTDIDRLARRKFAQEIFAHGGVKTADFEQHPERLDEMLRAELNL